MPSQERARFAAASPNSRLPVRENADYKRGGFSNAEASRSKRRKIRTAEGSSLRNDSRSNEGRGIGRTRWPGLLLLRQKLCREVSLQSGSLPPEGRETVRHFGRHRDQ